MADETPGTPGTATGGNAPGADMSFTIYTQYIKDLSVENPNAPQVFMDMKEAPSVAVNLNVTASRLRQGTFEVVIHANVKAEAQGKTAFMVELSYGGLVTIDESLSASQRETLLLIEAPRYLFPFARNTIGAATRDAGFPPLLINPVDFAKLYREQQAAAQPQKDGNAEQATKAAAAGDPVGTAGGSTSPGGFESSGGAGGDGGGGGGD